MFLAPGQCNVRPRCRSVSAFKRLTCVGVAVGVVDYFAENYEGGGVWYVVGGPCWSPPLYMFFFFFFFFFFFLWFPVLFYPSTRGYIRSAHGYRSGHVTTSMDRYGSAYPCAESSGGNLCSWTRAGVCRRWPRLRDVYRTVSCLLTGSLAMRLPTLQGLPTYCCTRVGVSILQ